MKTIVNIFCATALMSAFSAGFVACNEPKDPQSPDQPEIVGIAPVPAAELPEEVSAFFEKYLPAISGIRSEIFFVDADKDECLLLNSSEDLKKLISSNVELPTIDFDSYTLVIGQQTMPTSSFSVSNQTVDVKSNRVILNLTVKIPEASSGASSCLYHWGLFPKFSGSIANVNVTESK